METRRVKVPVATIWKSKESPRKVDEPALNGDVKTWVEQMSDQQSVDLSEDDLLETQALFNDEVIIDHIEGDWAKVYVASQRDDSDSRGYPGWVPVKLLSESAITYPPVTSIVRIAVRAANLYDENKQPVLEMSLGTVLPQTGTEGDMIEVVTPLGKGYIDQSAAILPFAGTNAGETMVEMARQFLGERYLWAVPAPMDLTARDLPTLCTGYLDLIFHGMRMISRKMACRLHLKKSCLETWSSLLMITVPGMSTTLGCTLAMAK